MGILNFVRDLASKYKECIGANDKRRYEGQKRLEKNTHNLRSRAGSASTSKTGKAKTGTKDEDVIYNTFPKPFLGVEDLELEYDGSKYALKYTSPRDNSEKITRYVYDDVEVLNSSQARIAQKQADGTYRYGVASTCGRNFIISDCNYRKVSFWNGSHAVMAIDEDGDEYAINCWGSISPLSEYMKRYQKVEDETE